MAPCRQLLMWSVPSIAVLLGIFWFRKKREYAKSDPGGREKIKCLKEELAEALNAEAESMRSSPLGKAERSIIKSAPIDIIPNGTGSQRSSPLVLTDEEVDLEIEKIIRKKSLEKDKRMSYSDKQNLVVSASCTKEASFVVLDKPSSLYSSFGTELSAKNDDHHSSLKIADDEINTISMQNLHGEFEGEISKDDSTKNDTTVSEVAAEEGTAADTEELNNNNNVEDEPSDSNDSDNRYSAAQTRRISERDSANHSPVDPMLASPSMCHFSDNHSEVSWYFSNILV